MSDQNKTAEDIRMEQLINLVDPLTRSRIQREEEEAQRASLRRRRQLIEAGVEAQINAQIDGRLEMLGKAQGFPPSRQQIMDTCEQVRYAITGRID